MNIDILSSLLACKANQHNFYKLLSTIDYTEQRLIASNKDTSANILTVLSGSKNSWVRSSVAYNPSTPNDIIAKLSADTAVIVREAVALNTSTPIEILTILFNDKDSYIRKVAYENGVKRSYKF